MSDGSLSQDEIDALLAGVESTTFKKIDPEDLIGEEDERSIKKAFAKVPPSKKTTKSNVEIILDNIGKNINDLLSLKKKLEAIHKVTKMSREDYLPDSYKNYHQSIKVIEEEILKAVAYGYETIKNEEEFK